MSKLIGHKLQSDDLLTNIYKYILIIHSSLAFHFKTFYVNLSSPICRLFDVLL